MPPTQCRMNPSVPSNLWNRREVMRRSMGTWLAALLVKGPQRSSGKSQRMTTVPPSGPLGTLQDPRVKALAGVALDAARTAGATYADVRFSIYKTRSIVSNSGADTDFVGCCVRALVDGYWGWAVTPYLAETEVPRVARQAVLLAKANVASGIGRVVDWLPVPVVTNGSWTTSITTDPFDVPIEEIVDFQEGLNTYVYALGGSRHSETPLNQVMSGLVFSNVERLFASTEGAQVHQQTHIVQPVINFIYKNVVCSIDIADAQAGWEYVATAPIRDLVRRKMDEVDHTPPLPVRPVEIGRSDLVCTAPVVANFVTGTFGGATQIDRALGYEANAGGTSYLGPEPMAQLGHSVASPLLTLIADNTLPRGMATVGWDDEGVAPEPFPIIQRGVLVDYQTTREQASWLAPWYNRRGVPVRSHGCAAAPSALALQMQHTPNLVMQPGDNTTEEIDLVQGLTKGYLVENLKQIQMDSQLSGGYAIADLVAIRNGQRVAKIINAGILFRTPELWNAMQAIGGAASIRWGSALSSKGEPLQAIVYSLKTVPALFTQQVIVDPRKKA